MTSKASLGLAVVVAALLVTTPAAAARYHVYVGGTRTSGPSTPDNWWAANCYGTIAGALAAAAPGDSVLLYDQSHVLDTSATLSCVLTNRHLLAVPEGAEIVFGAAGTLAVDSNLATTEITGVQFVGTTGPRILAALTVANAAATVETVTVRGCTFGDLTGGTQAGAGGSALRAASPGNGAALVIADCTFTGNQTQGSGGAVWIGGGYAVSITASAFTANHTTGGGQGGAIMVAATAALSSITVEDCVFADNTAAGPGGALNLDSASLVMRRCVVRGSRSAWEEGAWWKEGAGLRVTRSGGHTDPVEVTIENTEFRENQGNSSSNNNGGDGGAVLVKGVDVTRMIWVEVDNCLFERNTNAQGAGLYIGRFCQGEVRYCRFIDNIAWYQGGGAFKGGELPECEGELATFAYCEFRGNRAGFQPDGSETGEYSRGGGLGVRNHPRAHVYNCTFVDNRVNNFTYAIGDGFAHALEGGDWTTINRCMLVNCAFWGTGGDIQVRSEGSGGMETVSQVAVQSGQMSVPGTTPVGTVWLTSLPFVGPVDLRPASGSPLIDAGVPVAYVVDLSGLPVPYGPAFDIGCYEDHGSVAVEDLPGAGSPALTAVPNPFNPRTALRARLDEASSVRVAIYDSRGRRVTELFRGDLPAGTHELRWDGCDDRGRAVAAGTYIACLEATGRVPVVTKLVLVR
jgi:hypothetical protein